MTFTAKVNFNRCGRYQQPRSFPVLNPGFVESDVIGDNLLRSHGIFDHQLPMIEDQWCADRFNFTLDIKFPSMMYATDGILLHGHTSAGDVLRPETRLYFDRIIGYSDVTMMAASGVPEVHTRLRYDAHITAPLTKSWSEPQEMKYLMDYPSIMRRAGSEMTFAHFAHGGCEVKNLTAQILGPVTYNTQELSPSYFGETLRNTVLNYADASMGIDAEPTELYELGYDLSHCVRLDATRFFQALFNQSHYRLDSYITYGELVEFLSKDSSITVNVSTEDLPAEPTALASPEAERIFMDLARWAITSAGHEGVRTGNAVIDCDPTDVDGKMSIYYDQRLFNDFDNGEDDLYEIEQATLNAGSKLLPLRSVTLAKLYNVGYFTADIDFDVFGDIHGSVTISGSGTENFRIPAWYFGSFGGMVGTELQINNLARVTKAIADVSLLKASGVF